MIDLTPGIYKVLGGELCRLLETREGVCYVQTEKGSYIRNNPKRFAKDTRPATKAERARWRAIRCNAYTGPNYLAG